MLLILTVFKHKNKLNMQSLALLLFAIHLALTGRHSNEYFGTVVCKNKNISEVTAVGMVDDEVIMYFNSNTLKVVPRTDWIKKIEVGEYWNRRTEHALAILKAYENTLHNIMDLFNNSDIHTFQMMYGCELEDDGTTRGYWKFGYDGDDFISFDKNTLSYTAANHQADIIKDKWDTDRAKAKYWQQYLENACIEWLRKIVRYGKDSLEKKSAPEVSLLQKYSLSPVICHATCFYPKNITMTWKKNHEDLNEDVEVSLTFPNVDGTFQKSISLSVKSEEWKKNPDVYRCVIQHVGTEIVVTLNENNIKSNSASDNFIVKCLVSITVAVIVGCLLAFTVFAVKKRLIACKKSREVKSQNSTVYVKGSATGTTSEISDEPLHNAKCKIVLQ
ncbi:major histocompatibility complex class I-related gene protein-like [Triplophysa rosa]|uniref:major histocompatibility complex class I-related gene protein-like n=1 Tax=Triplophysa rosa TaxID=992332 RepID=UPI002545CA8F|nr:major histocompatibility complex class I-related gene protein-like [Triplophysa rosa]